MEKEKNANQFFKEIKSKCKSENLGDLIQNSNSSDINESEKAYSRKKKNDILFKQSEKNSNMNNQRHLGLKKHSSNYDRCNFD